jgi:hypothetical protein
MKTWRGVKNCHEFKPRLRLLTLLLSLFNQ